MTIFKMDEGIDSGPIVVQKTFPIAGEDSLFSAIKKSKAVSAEITIQALDLIASGQAELKPNPDEEMSYFRFPTREDVKEFWKRGKRF